MSPSTNGDTLLLSNLVDNKEKWKQIAPMNIQPIQKMLSQKPAISTLPLILESASDSCHNAAQKVNAANTSTRRFLGRETSIYTTRLRLKRAGRKANKKPVRLL